MYSVRLVTLVLLLLSFSIPGCSEQKHIDVGILECGSLHASPERSIAACTKLIILKKNKGPELVSAYHSRASAYTLSKKYDSAIKDLRVAIKLSPDNSELYTLRGIAYMSKKVYNHALQDFNKALQINPKNKFSYEYRGYTHYKTRNYDAAIRDFSKRIQFDPDLPEPYYERGRSYLRKGDSIKARKDFDKTIQLNSKSDFKCRCSVYFMRSQAKFDTGDYLGAMSDFMSSLY